MKKRAYSLAALILTAALLAFAPGLQDGGKTEKAEKQLLVVWMQEGESETAGWLKKAAAAYEVETGIRVYLRYAARAEREAALSGEKAGAMPDAVTGMKEGIVLAVQGWVLAVPGATGPQLTPAPTPALFIRPTEQPRQAEHTPVPLPVKPANVAVPSRLAGVMPEAVVWENPAAALTDGKADGALLTPRQALRMKEGYLFDAGGGCFLPVQGKAYTDEGRQFLAFLRSAEGQRLLAGNMMFSWDPEYFLYGADKELLFQMERCRKNFAKQE